MFKQEQRRPDVRRFAPPLSSFYGPIALVISLRSTLFLSCIALLESAFMLCLAIIAGTEDSL
jgi:hypothetical protein